MEDHTTSPSTSWTSTNTFAIAANRLALCWVVSVDNSDDGADIPLTFTQTGRTYTRYTTYLPGPATRISLYYDLGASSGAAAVSMTWDDAQDSAIVMCAEAANVDTTGVNGLGAIAEVITGGTTGAGTNLNTSGTLDLSLSLATRDTNSALIAGYGIRQNCTWTARSGYTLGALVQEATPTVEGRLTYAATGVDILPSATVGVCSASTTGWAGIAVEVLPDTTTDVGSPVVAITFPTVGSTYQVSTAAGFGLAGIATDNTGVSSVTWACGTCTPASGTASGTADWTISNVTLGCSGGGGTSNAIVVTATDAAANTGTDTLTVTCINPGTIAPTLTITQPLGTPTTVSAAAQTLVGTASDETALHATQAVTWSCAACSVTSGTATGSTDWTFGVTLGCSSGAGTSNTVIVTAKDTSNNTAQGQRVIICATADVTAPTVDLVSSSCNTASDADCAGTVATVTVVGTAADAVGVDHVQVTSTTCVPASAAASGTIAWTSPALTCPTGANTITVTAYDEAGNASTPESFVYTYTAPLAIVTTSCPGAQTGVAYQGCTVSATGGSGTYTWSENGSALGSGFCTGFSFADVGATGLLSAANPTTAGDCEWTPQVNDGVTTVVKSSPLIVHVTVAAVEGPNDYFNTLRVLPTAVVIDDCKNTNRAGVGTAGCDFRSQAQIEANDEDNAFPNSPGICAYWPNCRPQEFQYLHPGESSLLCYNAVTGGSGGPCNDDYGDTHGGYNPDAMKMIKPDTSTTASVFSRNTFQTMGSQFAVTDTALIIWDMYWDISYRDNADWFNNGQTAYIKTLNINLSNTAGFWTASYMNFYKAQLTKTTNPDVVGYLIDSVRGGEPCLPAQTDCASLPTTNLGWAMWKIGYQSSDPLVPSNGVGTLKVSTANIPIYHSKWTRYIAEIQYRKPYATAFTEWEAAYNVTMVANPCDRDGLGRWHKVSLWVIDEDLPARRVIYHAPINYNVGCGTPGRSGLFTDFAWSFNTSPANDIQTGSLIAYMRNWILLKNYETTPGSGNFLEESDAVIFKRPVR